MKHLIALFMSLALCACSDPAGDPPVDAEALATHNAAVAAMGAYDYEQAWALLLPLADARPGWVHGQVDLAIAQLNRQGEGDEAAALARLEQVRQAHPDDARAWYVSGLLLLNAGRADEAVVAFDRALQAAPDDAYAAYYAGQARMQAGAFGEALPLLERAIEANPYLRSSYYAASQAARRTGQAEQADALLETFQRMEHNPRALLAELKYTRMGPLAMVRAIDEGVVPQATPRLDGPLFASAINLGALDHAAQAIAVCVTADRTIITVALPDGVQSLTPRGGTVITGFEAATKVRSIMWGDVNDDLRPDAVLLRDGPDELWLQQADGTFSQDSGLDSNGVAVDGALFDADHDGDLDVLVLDADGRLQLQNNNGDGTWRSITQAAFGDQAHARSARQLVVADLDADLDTDILVVHDQAPHVVWVNDRLWDWRQGEGERWRALLDARISAAVAADLDADGTLGLVATTHEGGLAHLQRVGGLWGATTLAPATTIRADARQLAVADIDGDGVLDIIVPAPDEGTAVLEVLSRAGEPVGRVPADGVWTLLHLAGGEGPGLVQAAGSVLLRQPGSGRHLFVDIQLAGRVDPGQSMRSNGSGIGATLAARTGSRWTITGTLRNTAGPGQDLQPVSIGLGGAEALDFISIDWSDGVYQSEPRLAPGELHTIVETQRQLSSCPVIFAWNGERMAFITDCLGVGGIGFMLAPDRYMTPRPFERVLLPDAGVAPLEGSYLFEIAEPMQETCYLDAAALLVVDVPDGWEVLPDERMGTGGVPPTSELLFSRHEAHPSKAITSDNRDATNALAHVDGEALEPGPVHGRFIGRTNEPLDLTVWFDASFDMHPGVPLLVIDGWVEYPYGQTMFAAWQAGVTYAPFSVQVQLPGGFWVDVATTVGYPAGMPRTMVLPLGDLPEGARNIRLHSTLECYIDALRIAWAEPCPEARVHRLEPSTAILHPAGYPRRTSGAQKRPIYDWSNRTPFWDVRAQSGLYTRLGDVRPLLERTDGVIAVYGAGDSVHLAFDELPPPASGVRRQWVLEVAGWAKDMDFMTRTGATVAPLPGNRTPEGAALQQATQVRWRDGR